MYDGRASRNAGQQSSQSGRGKSRNQSSSGSDSEVEDCQFDFEEQSEQALRVPQASHLNNEHDQANKYMNKATQSSAVSPKPSPNRLAQREPQATKPVRTVEVMDAERSASLSEVIESKFKNLTILTSLTNRNGSLKADSKEEVDKSEQSRKALGVEILQEKAAADAGDDEGPKASLLSASSPSFSASATPTQKDEQGSEVLPTSPQGRSFRPLSLFRGWARGLTENLQDKIQKAQEKQYKPIDYSKVWEQVFESVNFIEIEADVDEITSQVQQQMRKTSINGSISGSMISIYGDKRGSEMEYPTPQGHPRREPKAPDLNSDQPFDLADFPPSTIFANDQT